MVGKRKDGTVYVDYLQNIQGKTLACAYSARGERVCRGVDAAHLEGGARPPDPAGLHDRHDAGPRSRAVGDLWASLRRDKGANLLAAIEKLR